MSNRPLVSILIPVYKRVDLSCETIECALKQDYPNYEIIIGDNCSEDGSYEILCNRYADEARIFIFQNDKNLGAVGNWKKCLEKANGKYIKFLWSDDLMRSDFISRAVMMLENNHDAAFAYSAVRMFDENLENDIEIVHDTVGLTSMKMNKQTLLYCMRKTGIYSSNKFMKNVFKNLYRAPVSPGCAIFRKEKVVIEDEIPNDIGYQHKNNGAGPDLLIFLNALKNCEKFIYIDEPMNYFRKHESSISCSDNTIRIGYYLAKKYYLLQNGMDNYIKWINACVIADKPGWDFFHCKRNDAILQRYCIDITDTIHGKRLIPYIFIIKVKNKLAYFRV